MFGFINRLLGGGGNNTTTDVAAQTQNDISVEPITNVQNNISTTVDFTQAGQLISGSLDGFNDQVGTAGVAVSDGLRTLGKGLGAISLIGLIGWSLK